MISTKRLGERIAMARNRSGLTQSTLAERLGVSRPTLLAVEKGRRRPTDTELVRLAELLGTSVHELVSETVITGGAAPRFRHSGRFKVTSETEAAAATLEKLGKWYSQLERLCGISRTRAPLESVATYRADTSAMMDPELAGEHGARMLRATLGAGDGPVFDLDERLEAVAGLRIFYFKLPSNIAGLFIWGEEIGGCIGINAGHPRERQRWTLVHEVGHFLRDREAGDVLPTTGPPRMDPSEIFSESITKHFLMPNTTVSARFADHTTLHGRGFRVADLVELAHEFGVSFQAMCLRLEELGHLRSGTYDRLTARRFKPSHAMAQLGLVPPKRRRRLPERYVMLALRCYEQEEISEGELAEYLITDRVGARALYQERRRQILENGDYVDLNLDEEVMRNGGALG